MGGPSKSRSVRNHYYRHPPVFSAPFWRVIGGHRLAATQAAQLDVLFVHTHAHQYGADAVGAAQRQWLVVGFLARAVGVAVDTYTLDAHAEQGLANAFDNDGAGWVEGFDIAAKQHFAGQAKCPAFVGEFKTLLFEDGDLCRGQAFGRGGLAAA